MIDFTTTISLKPHYVIVLELTQLGSQYQKFDSSINTTHFVIHWLIVV